MKIIFLSLFVVLGLHSFCSAQKSVGSFAVMATKSIDSNVHYVLLKQAVNTTEREIELTREISLDEAFNKTLKNVPGGIYMKNITVYTEKLGSLFYYVTGDVYGIVIANPDFNGFHKGDKVQWKVFGKVCTGEITNLDNSTECTIKQSPDGNNVNISYAKLSKAP